MAEKTGKVSRKDLLRGAFVTGVAAALGADSRLPVAQLAEAASLPAPKRKERFEALGFAIVPVELNWTRGNASENRRGQAPSFALVERNGVRVGCTITFDSENLFGADRVQIQMMGRGITSSGVIFSQELPRSDIDRELATEFGSQPVDLIAMILDSNFGFDPREPFPQVLGPNMFAMEIPISEAAQVDVVFTTGSYEPGEYGGPFFKSKETLVWFASVPQIEPQKPRNAGRLA